MAESFLSSLFGPHTSAEMSSTSSDTPATTSSTSSSSSSTADSSTRASTTSSSSSTSTSTSSSTTHTTSSSTSSTHTTPSTTTTSSSSTSSSSTSSSSTSSTASTTTSQSSTASSTSTSTSASPSPTSTSSTPPPTTSSSSTSTDPGTPTTTSSTSTSYSLSTSFSTDVFQTTSDGTVIEYTTVTPVATVTRAANSDASNDSFFHNKGDVAGVFAVVGVIAALVIVGILTSAIRRRRAKRIDRDAEEAAVEAANARPPDFMDDDYGYPEDRTQEFGAGGPYSDTASHGTLSQAPMQHTEGYGMRELPPFDPYAAAGAASDPYAAAGAAGDPYSAAGAAGIGAAGVNRARSMGRNNPMAPYNAFAAPPVSMPAPYYDAPGMSGPYPTHSQGALLQHGPSVSSGGSGGNQDLYNAAGLGAGAATLAMGASQHMPQNGSLNRNKSLGATTLGGMSSSSDYSSTSAHQQPGYGAYPAMQNQGNAYGQPAAYAAAPNAATHTEEPTRLLAGNFSSPDTSAENGFEEDETAEHGGVQDPDDHRMSLRDDEDYTYGGERRVLKVANE